VKHLFIGLIRAYQKLISPFFAPRCKYYPSCSQYSIDAIRAYGSIKGIALTAWRLLRCNPFSHGGVDYAAKSKVLPLTETTNTLKVSA